MCCILWVVLTPITCLWKHGCPPSVPWAGLQWHWARHWAQHWARAPQGQEPCLGQRPRGLCLCLCPSRRTPCQRLVELQLVHLLQPRLEQPEPPQSVLLGLARWQVPQQSLPSSSVAWAGEMFLR